MRNELERGESETSATKEEAAVTVAVVERAKNSFECE